MEYRLLGGSGLKVPVLSFGTGTFGGTNEFFRKIGSTGLEEAKRLIDIALDAGVNLFDTADVYSDGVSEEILGQALEGRRDRALVATKACFRTMQGPNGLGASRYHLIRSCEASLRRLRTDHIDLYQTHGFDPETPVEETMRALDDLVRAGKVRYIGCSNHSGWHLMKSLAVSDARGLSRYVTHQAYYSLIGREYEWELLPLARDQRIGTMVWSPLAAGKLTGKLRRGKEPPEGTRVREMTNFLQPVGEDYLYRVIDALDEVAREAEKTMSQVAINWLLQRPTVVTVIFGARNEEQLRQNLDAASFTLSAEQVAKLDAASEIAPIYPYWHQRETLGERGGGA